MPPLARSRTLVVVAAVAAVLATAVVAGVALGAVPLAPADVVRAIGHGLLGRPAGIADALVLDLRLPRVVLAALVGMCLAAAGTLYQALFRNPLADPYILGVSSGAGLGATLALVAGAGLGVSAFVAVPVAAFAGAVASIAIVVAMTARRGRLDMLSLLLAGVAVSYTLAAVTSFVMVFSRQTMQQVVFWMMGGLQTASWAYVVVVAVMLAVGLAAPLLYTRDLDVMLLGDERAAQLGIDVERFKLVMLVAASLMVAAAVSVSGLIGFVGLMTPHMARLVLGPDHRRLLPVSVLAGGVVLVLADLAARVVLAPVELPVGIVTAVLGGPFFVWLLLQAERGA